MSYTERKSLVIPNGVRQNGADCWAVLDPDSGGAKTFSVALEEIADPTKTWWGTLTPLEVETYEALTTMSTTTFKDYVNSLAVERERGQVSGAAFLNSLEIGGPDFWGFIASMGLQRVAVEI